MCTFCNFNEERDWFGEEECYTEVEGHHAYFSLEGIPTEDGEIEATIICFQDKGGMMSDHWDTVTVLYCPMCGRKL